MIFRKVYVNETLIVFQILFLVSVMVILAVDIVLLLFILIYRKVEIFFQFFDSPILCYFLVIGMPLTFSSLSFFIVLFSLIVFHFCHFIFSFST